ncbi:MAG: dTDP-glucose 4,6-dehydratase [Chloroflexota bacterium]|nr:dTDP-glucose 4,6-dehydratase [Chloroflexota bacterium]
MRRILVTGGAGFIGSHFIRRLLREHPAYDIINIDKLTYAGNLDNLRDVEDYPRYQFVQGDICDRDLVDELMGQADAIVHFAAETHVDRSLLAADAFIQTDVAGTYTLLCAARDHRLQRFLHVSTDEVYGDVPQGHRSRESDPFQPRSPYAASKAGGDLMCGAFYQTYGLPLVIARPANNVGPHQHPEKMVPLFVTNALQDQPLPLYGDGLQERDWLYVEDDCQALDLLLHEGRPGEAYNIGADNHRHNVRVAEAILDLLGKPRDLIRHVEDRPGHDRRYALDWSKLRAMGWSPAHDFDQALARTVAWYRDNEWWWRRVRSGAYQDYYQQQYGWRLAQAARPARGEGQR